MKRQANVTRQRIIPTPSGLTMDSESSESAVAAVHRATFTIRRRLSAAADNRFH
jgi:hypothetical protein